MKLSVCILIGCGFLALNPTSKMIKDSTSSDGKFHLVVESREDGIYYQVEAKNGSSASEEIASDFGTIRSLDEACSFTSVHWYPDNAYCAFFTGHDRHHVDFFILAHTSTGYEVLPFDWEKLTKFSQRPPLGFAYPAFIRWLPGDRAEIDLFESDGRSTTRDSSFVIDLADHLKPVSWKILQPEHALKTQ